MQFNKLPGLPDEEIPWPMLTLKSVMFDGKAGQQNGCSPIVGHILGIQEVTSSVPRICGQRFSGGV